MCFQKREFYDLNNPEFDDENWMENPMPIIILLQPLEQDLANLEDMHDSTTTTNAIRSPRLLNMAFIKMTLKKLMIRLSDILWTNFIILICLLLLPEKSTLVFINPAEIIPSDTGCPDDTKCNMACQEDPRFNTNGCCVGPDRMLCSCGPLPNTTDLPVNAEATACNDQECEWKCAEYRMPMAGECIGGVCKCGYNVTITGFQPTEIIPNKYCVVPCCMPFTLSYGFECHDGKVSARKWIVNWRKQVADLTRAASAVEGGGGMEKNASEKCDDTVGSTETKISTINMKL